MGTSRSRYLRNELAMTARRCTHEKLMKVSTTVAEAGGASVGDPVQSGDGRTTTPTPHRALKQRRGAAEGRSRRAPLERERETVAYQGGRGQRAAATAGFGARPPRQPHD